MEVIEELDEKIKVYHDKLKRIKKLREDANALNQEKQNTEDEIKIECENIKNLKQEEIIDIQLSDLLNQIATNLGISVNDLDVIITVKQGIYDLELKSLPSNVSLSCLNISLRDGKNILCEEISMFNDLEEIENDGKSLLNHCILEPSINARHSLIIKENIDDIICHFKLEAIDYENYRENYILPDAIRKCLLNSEKEKGKQYIKRWKNFHLFIILFAYKNKL